MIKLFLAKLLCKHEWYEYKVIPIYDSGHDLPSYYIYILICKNCGKVKKIKI